MNKYVILAFTALVAVALSAPQHQPDADPVYILKHDSEIHPDGYHFDFETSDGTARQEVGTLKQISEDHQAIQVQGSYKYVAPDGLIYTITYTADENGFKPQERVEHSGSN